MLEYFPFGDAFDARMGARVLAAGEPLCAVEPDRYPGEVALKRRLLSEMPAEYFRGGAETLTAQWDVLALVLESLAESYPAGFTLEKQGDAWRWRNRLLGEAAEFRFGEGSSLPLEPLDWAGRQVQEDLVLVGGDERHRVAGGQLCFANSWSLGSHAGKSFFELHAPTPQTTYPAVEAGYRLLENLKPGKTVWRLNWNFKLSDELDLSTRHQARYDAHLRERGPQLTGQSAGREVFLRVERQTLTRLPRSGMILFGIHTYLSRLEDEAADPARARSILNVLQTAPQDVKEYKALAVIERAMRSCLEAALASG